MPLNSGPAPLASLLQADDSSVRLASLLDSVTDAIITIDSRQRIVQYNKAAERIFDWSNQQMLGQPLTRLIPEQFQQAHIDHVKRFGTTGVTSRHMGGTALIHGVRANGEQFPLDASISQIDTADGKLFTVILRDVTEKVRVAHDKASLAAQLSALVESAMDAIISVNDAQQIVLYNRAAESLFGWSREQALGQSLDLLIPERFRSRHRAHIQRFATSRRAGDATVLCGLRANGEEFPMEASISQVETDSGKLFTVILRDITDRVRSQEELRSFSMRAHAAIESEKTRVARELHDELAQSLTALKMDAIWMRDNLPQGEQSLTNKINGMLSILDNTVVATRRIAADLRPLVLDDLGLVAATQWLAQSFSQRTGVACELLVNESLELAEPYATAVFRIVQESLANIAKHAKASQVQIRIECITDSVHITVSDNGQGFATDTPPKQESLGLRGLRERAELLRGRVEIKSQLGGGTHISVNIPVDEPGAAL
jgi:PAS domain S-box-containing protein